MQRNRLSNGRSGVSLLEYLIAVSILSIFMGTLVVSSSSMIRMETVQDVRVQAQEAGERALAAILDDMRVSGFVFGTGTPYLFEDGLAEEPFEVHAHDPAQKTAVEGDLDFGPNREIVFLLPLDDDSDGVPDLSPEGDLLFSPDQISYVVVSGPDGENRLERRTNGGSARTIVRHVERLTFDTIQTDATVPFGAVRVRIWFRVDDGDGRLVPHFVEATTRLRN